jgi:uncharacterized protein
MFARHINRILMEWKNRANRKPLVVRGARQVGKTSAVHMFGKAAFENYIYINLEIEDNAALFAKTLPLKELVQLIQLKFNQRIKPGSTLIFIDEIQNSPVAMNQMRFFHEEMPDVHIISAGSLLEVKIKTEGFTFPVGRVEYCYMHPVTFDEFLSALGETEASDLIASFKSDEYPAEEIHSVMMKKFHHYMIVGGMPEAVARYAEAGNFMDADPIYESILTGFRDDVVKYAGSAKTKYIQHIIEHASKYVGLRIRYEKFGESNFRSREMSEAFDVLEKAMIINRVFASASRQIPLMGNLKKAPKFLHLDIGLVNYQLGIRSEIASIDDINAVYHGQLGEQIVGQTLLSLNIRKNAPLHYWYRDQKGAISEVDYLLTVDNRLVPVEVKSGKTGSLRSLNQFMDESGSDLAVRVYSGPFARETITTSSKKKFILLSVPFYLFHRIHDIL